MIFIKKLETEEKIKAYEAENLRLAKAGWLLLSKEEKENLKRAIEKRWDKMPKFIKDRISSKESYFKIETQEYCITRTKKNKVI